MKRINNNFMKLLNLFIIVLIFIFVLIFLSYNLYTKLSQRHSLENYVFNVNEKNKAQNFIIDKIVFFSSCNCNSSINSNSSININNLTQYTDIAIFINNSTTNFSLSNTLKSVKIENLNIYNKPSLGNSSIYYKNINEFTTPIFHEKNLINNNLEFNITSNDQADFSEPVLYNNCANPITLSYVNSNIKENYTLSSSDTSFVYNGSLLKKCNILLNDIKSSFGFTLLVENNLGEHFKCPVYIDIPLENSLTSIYEGNFTYILNKKISFYRYK